MDDAKDLTFDWQEEKSKEMMTVTLEELEFLTGFPKEHIAGELLLDESSEHPDRPLNTEKLRDQMLKYLNSFTTS